MAMDLTAYKLYYYEVGAPEQHDLNTDLTTSYILDGLTGYTEYSFRVLAYNQNGAGVSTDEVIARTYSGSKCNLCINWLECIAISLNYLLLLAVLIKLLLPDGCAGLYLTCYVFLILQNQQLHQLMSQLRLQVQQ